MRPTGGLAAGQRVAKTKSLILLRHAAAATDDGAELAIVAAESSDKESEAEEKAAETIEDPSELGEDDMAEVIEGIETPEKADV